MEWNYEGVVMRDWEKMCAFDMDILETNEELDMIGREQRSCLIRLYLSVQHIFKALGVNSQKRLQFDIKNVVLSRSLGFLSQLLWLRDERVAAYDEDDDVCLSV